MPNKDSQMNVDVKTTSMDMTPAVSDYLTEKLLDVERLINVKEDTKVQVDIELGKTTERHQSGPFYKAEMNLMLDGQMFRVVAEEADLYAAIDAMKDQIMRELRQDKEKKETLVRGGSRKAKEMLRNTFSRE